MVGDAQRVDDHAVVAEEFHEIHPAESGGVLVLPAAGHAQVDALDFVGEAGDVIFSQREVPGFDESAQDGDHKRGRSAQAGAGRHVHLGGQLEGEGLSVVELPDDPVVDAALEGQRSLRFQVGDGVVFLHEVLVDVDEADLAVIGGPEGRIGETVDRHVEDGASVQVGVRRDVRASAGDAEAERRLAAI